MRVLAARTLLTVAVACGLAVTSPVVASAADEDLDVSVSGVSYHGRDRGADEDVVSYSIRTVEGWRYRWLSEPLPRGRSGFVPFSSAAAAMPDGYCVVYVRVPGVGEWTDEGRTCTETAGRDDADRDDEPSPTPTASATPTPEDDEDERDRDRDEDSPSAGPEPAPTPTPTPTPTTTPSPTVSPSSSPSTSPSPRRSRSASPSPSPSAVAAPVNPGALVAVDTRDNPQNVLLDGDVWAGAGLALAVAGIAAGGFVAWRSRRVD